MWLCVGAAGARATQLVVLPVLLDPVVRLGSFVAVGGLALLACATAQHIVQWSGQALQHRQPAVHAALRRIAGASSLVWRLRQRTVAAWPPFAQDWAGRG